MLGHWELIVVLVVVLLIFGPSQLPKLAKGLGKSIKSFKSGMKDGTDEEDKEPAGQIGPGSSGQPPKELPTKQDGE